MSKLNIKLDEAIDHHNQHCEPKKIMTRMVLGKKLMPEFTEGTINKTLSQWQNGKMVPTPTPQDLCNIADATGCTVDFLLGRSKNPTRTIKKNRPKRIMSNNKRR